MQYKIRNIYDDNIEEIWHQQTNETKMFVQFKI